MPQPFRKHLDQQQLSGLIEPACCRRTQPDSPYSLLKSDCYRKYSEAFADARLEVLLLGISSYFEES